MTYDGFGNTASLHIRPLMDGIHICAMKSTERSTLPNSEPRYWPKVYLKVSARTRWASRNFVLTWFSLSNKWPNVFKKHWSYIYLRIYIFSASRAYIHDDRRNNARNTRVHTNVQYTLPLLNDIYFVTTIYVIWVSPQASNIIISNYMKVNSDSIQLCFRIWFESNFIRN